MAFREWLSAPTLRGVTPWSVLALLLLLASARSAWVVVRDATAEKPPPREGPSSAARVSWGARVRQALAAFFWAWLWGAGIYAAARACFPTVYLDDGHIAYGLGGLAALVGGPATVAFFAGFIADRNVSRSRLLLGVAVEQQRDTALVYGGGDPARAAAWLDGELARKRQHRLDEETFSVRAMEAAKWTLEDEAARPKPEPPPLPSIIVATRALVEQLADEAEQETK